MNLFGFSSGDLEQGGEIALPDTPEFTPRELMQMEHEVTGLYLSGHPMDEYRQRAAAAGALSIGSILADFADENGPMSYTDGQNVVLAGIVSAYRTRMTRNRSIMAYVTLEDGTGAIEMLAFQKTIEAYGGRLKVNNPIIAEGRLSARDEKEPQIMLNSARLVGEESNPRTRRAAQRKLYVKFPDERDARYERLRLVLKMFPGNETLVMYFDDTKKKLVGNCAIHDALIEDLGEMLGGDNVVVRSDADGRSID
jgi:DNA polymerase-3 subunit alpha